MLVISIDPGKINLGIAVLVHGCSDPLLLTTRNCSSDDGFSVQKVNQLIEDIKHVSPQGTQRVVMVAETQPRVFFNTCTEQIIGAMKMALGSFYPDVFLKRVSASSVAKYHGLTHPKKKAAVNNVFAKLPNNAGKVYDEFKSSKKKDDMADALLVAWHFIEK